MGLGSSTEPRVKRCVAFNFRVTRIAATITMITTTTTAIKNTIGTKTAGKTIFSKSDEPPPPFVLTEPSPTSTDRSAHGSLAMIRRNLRGSNLDHRTRTR